jgi:hypothetical protein
MKERKISLAIATVIISILILSGCQSSTISNSQNTGNGSKYVNGKVKGITLYKATETNDAIKWIEDTKRSMEDSMASEIDKTTDPEKLKDLKKDLAESKKRSAKDMFKIEKDGSASFETNMPFLKLVMDGTITTTTDKDGFYSFENPTVGKHKIEIYYNDKFLRAEEIDIKNENINYKKESNAKKDLNIIMYSNFSSK